MKLLSVEIAVFKPLHEWSSKEVTGNEYIYIYKKIILRFYSVKLNKIEEN